jgi:hypothetical protein
MVFWQIEWTIFVVGKWVIVVNGGKCVAYIVAMACALTKSS